jgi:hypothetical protein
VAPMTTNRTLCSFNNLSSSSTSTSLAPGGHLTALAEHHLKPLLRRQRRKIVQFELDFHTFVVRSLFQYTHRSAPALVAPFFDHTDHCTVHRSRSARAKPLALGQPLLQSTPKEVWCFCRPAVDYGSRTSTLGGLTKAA